MSELKLTNIPAERKYKTEVSRVFNRERYPDIASGRFWNYGNAWSIPEDWADRGWEDPEVF